MVSHRTTHSTLAGATTSAYNAESMAPSRPPPPRSQTARQRLREMLGPEPMSARELSQAAGLSDKDVLAHLAHFERSAKASGEKLVILPARCRDCAYRFEARLPRARPSRCPRCRSERIEAARFGLLG